MFVRLSPSLIRTALILVVATVVISMAGVLRWALSPVLTAARPWQAQVSTAAADDDDMLIDLRERLAATNARAALLAERVREYEEIADRLGGDDERDVAQRLADRILTRARIIARSDRPSRHFCEIDAGAVDGVRHGLAVISGWSLIGVVVGERSGTAVVRQIGDRDSRVPASLIVLDDQGQAIGEVLGVCAGIGERSRFELRFIEDRPGLEVVPGWEVVTAPGHAEVPAGLVLGQVEEAHRQEHDDHWLILVRPLRDPERIRTVLVLRSLLGG